MPVPVFFGAGCLDELSGFRGRFRVPAILCGRASARTNGALDSVLSHFPGARVFDAFPENPRTSVCESYADECRRAGVDGIIALGGGSVMDGAKAIALLIPNDGCCDDYFESPPLNAPLPVIAIPTTAGTGSEVTPYSVLVDAVAGKKKTLKHPGLYPVAALLDPSLTVTLPPATTLATGLDALSQGMEGLLSRKATPMGDILALEVCLRVSEALPRVVRDPQDLAAREALLYGAMLSGVVIAQSGTTLVHGMGYYYTLEFGIAHGAANALLLPPVFAWNARFEAAKVAALAGALGNPCASEPDAAGPAIVDALYALYENVGFDRAARAHGVSESSGSAFAADIIGDPYRFKNQVGELGEATVARFYRSAWAGEMVPFWLDSSS